MRRKSFNKLLGITLTVAMTAGLVACGGNQKPTTSESAKGTEQTASSETEVVAVEDEELTYPLDTEDTLSIWSNSALKPVSAYSDYKESPFHIGLAENTGVDVEWIFAADGADEASVFNLMLTDDVLPDVIYQFINTSSAGEFIEDGVIYDLTEYLPKYAPDYWAYLNEHPELQKHVKTADGAIFGFGSFTEGDYNKTYTGPAVRQDWLDECGLKAPVTLEDWENMLVTFKEKYGARLGFTNRFRDLSSLASGTGAMATFKATWYADDNGQIQLAQAQPEWKEYMKILNKWWEMGLIDEDSLTMSDADMRTKVANNEIGATCTAMSQITNYTVDAEATGNGANWVGVEYPRTAAGEPTCMIQTNTSYLDAVGMVTTSCSEEKLATVLAWLNYGYTEEGMKYWNFGTEGETYTVDAAGNYAWTDLISNDPDGLNQAVKRYTGVASAGLTIQASKFVEMKNTPASAAAVYEWVKNTEAGKHFVPGLSLGVEESVEYSDLFTNVHDAVGTAALEFVTGERSLDEFDAFVEELQELGLDRCRELQQEAYDVYLGN